MVLEVAILTVIPEQTEEFEASFKIEASENHHSDKWLYQPRASALYREGKSIYFAGTMAKAGGSHCGI